jgi:hypothetical protein
MIEQIGWSIFAAGTCMGTMLGLVAGLAIRRRDTPVPSPPACPLDDIPPGPPELRIVRRAYDWQRDGAA